MFHDHRRTATTTLRRANVDALTAVKITGHKTMAVFTRYNTIDEDNLTIGVHLSRCLQIAAAGLLLRDGLAAPAAERIQDRGATTPVRISRAMREQCCELLPAPLRCGSLEVKGLSDGLAGDR